MGVTRRRFLTGLAGMAALSGLSFPSKALTPRQSAGPFYPDQPLLDDDNDLTRVPGRVAPAKGAHTDLQGRLLDRNGKPISGARIEIWQCDANGRYRHTRDPSQAQPDPGFQGKGSALTDREGRYRFRTIRPVPYPGRTPHIHVAVFTDQPRPFTTQLYVAGEPGNGEDFLYRRVPAEHRDKVTAVFAPTEGGLLAAHWDVILDVTGG